MTDSTINAAASSQRATQDHRHYLRPRYQPGIPAVIEVPDASPGELLETAACSYPDWVVIDSLGTAMTYRELLETSEQAAQVLRTSGVHKGDRVALTMPNCPQHAMAFYGALRIGAVVAEYNPLAPVEEIRPQPDAYRARVAIVWEKGVDLITDPRPVSGVDSDALQGRTVFSVNFSAAVPVRLRAVLCLPVERTRWQRAAFRAPRLPARVRSWDREVVDAHRIPSRFPYPAGLDIVVLLYTGGAAGVLKVTMLTHTDLWVNANQAVAWVLMLHEGGENSPCLLPFFHVFGLTFNLFRAVRRAATQVMLPKFSADQVLTAHERRSFTLFVGVPVMSRQIPDDTQKRGTNLGTSRYGVCGVTPTPPEVEARWGKATDGFFVEGYDMIKASPIVAGTPMGPSRHLGALGLPFPSTDVRVVNSEDPDPNRGVPDDEPDELLVRGPRVFAGCWEDEAATQAVILPRGRLRTGDIVRREDSFLWMAGRKRELILIGGFNVYPSQVEAAIHFVKGVADVVVVGLPDGATDELACAAVVLTEGTEPGSVTLEAARKHAERTTPCYALPHRLKVIEEMPRLQIGKILRRVVREQLASSHLRA